MNRQSKTKRSILVVLMIVCLIAVIGGTYSRYTSTGNVNATTEIADWHVVLGADKDITSATNTLNVPFVLDANTYVADGKIAPGRAGHFEFTINPDGSEVAIDYTITLGADAVAAALEAGSNAKIEITGASYTIGAGASTNATIVNDSFTISEALANVENGDIVTVTVNFAWDNASDARSASDTTEGAASYAEGIDGKSITIPVTVVADQKI